jgi:serine/threonine protein kinase
MKSLDNENICKCYKSFNEGSFQYIIMEYVDGENLLSFFNANKLMGLAIKEEKLMKIFLGCLNGLQYIHSKEIIHRNIKPINIIMDDNDNIKIIDFKYCSTKDNPDSKKLIIGGGNFLAPELSGESIDYNNNIDVYSMGVTFCSLAYFRTSLPNKRGENISEELYRIISKMVERDPKKRPSSSDVYNDLKSLYIKKNNDNFISSLSSSIRGLVSFPNFYEDLKSQNIRDSMPMTMQFLNCIEVLKEFTSSNNDKEREKKWNICLYDFKEFLLKSMNYNEEIEPIHIISFILRAMHKELNVPNNSNNNNNSYHNNIEYLSKKANKEEAYQNFVNYNNERHKSLISDRFFGTIKTKSICRVCRTGNTFFITYI